MWCSFDMVIISTIVEIYLVLVWFIYESRVRAFDVLLKAGYFTAPLGGGALPPLEKFMPPLGIEILGKVCL